MVTSWLPRGDPVANTEIVEILQYIRSINNKAEIQIRTNGGIGGVERFKQISEIIGGNGFLVFSVDGWEDTNHIYRKNVKWHKVKANMDAYLSGPGIMHWDYIVFKHNYHQISLAKEFARKNNIHLELKEPFGFEDEYKTREVYTLPVYSKQTHELLYEIEPETENEIPKWSQLIGNYSSLPNLLNCNPKYNANENELVEEIKVNGSEKKEIVIAIIKELIKGELSR